MAKKQKKLSSPPPISSDEKCPRGSKQVRSCKKNPVTGKVTCQKTKKERRPMTTIVLPTGKDGKWERKLVPVEYTLPVKEKKGKLVITATCQPDYPGRLKNIVEHARFQQRKAGTDPGRVWTQSEKLSQFATVKSTRQKRDAKNRFTKGYKKGQNWKTDVWEKYKRNHGIK